MTRTFEFVVYFVKCDTVIVSPNQIIVIIKLKNKNVKKNNRPRMEKITVEDNWPLVENKSVGMENVS